MNKDIRWQQRFANYKKALCQLESAVYLLRERELSDLEKRGLIQAFEVTHELAWNTLKDYLQWQGIKGITGSRDTVREAFSNNLLNDGEVWMSMLIDRNKTSHTYNVETANEIVLNIDQSYIDKFKELDSKMGSLVAKMGRISG